MTRPALRSGKKGKRAIWSVGTIVVFPEDVPRKNPEVLPLRVSRVRLR